MNKTFTVVFWIFYSALALGQTNTVVVGENVVLSQFNLEALNNRNLETGKIIILDFWATWCGPCIASFPHLEELQKKYSGDIQIITVNDEEKQKTTSFLKKKSFALTFFNNANKDLFKLFAIDARPVSCLLSATGKLEWVGRSSELDAILPEYLKTGYIAPANIHISVLNRRYFAGLEAPTEDKDILRYVIKTSNRENEYFAKTQKNIDATLDIAYSAVSVAEVIQDFMNVSSLQFKNSRPDLDTIFVDIMAKSGSERITYKVFSPKVLADLQVLYDFSVKEQVKETDVYALSVKDGAKIKTFQEESEGGGVAKLKDNTFTITRLTLGELSTFFQKKLNVFVVFEQGDVDKYNLTLEKFSSVEDLNRQLSSRYGLWLEKGTSPLRFVTLE